MEIIKTVGLTKIYRNGRGVRELDLSIEEGAVYGLLGPNGSGKTTTMKVLTGLLDAKKGDISVLGRDPQEARAENLAEIGCMIETPGLFPYLTAQQNLDIMCRHYSELPREWGDYVLNALEMKPYLGEKVKGFSMGMKQRLAFTMALYTRPKLLILDEPTNGMDINGSTIVRDVLKAYIDHGGTVIISSHLANEIEQICTHVGVMDQGQLLKTEQIDRLLGEYGSVESYYLAVVGEGKKGAVA